MIPTQEQQTILDYIRRNTGSLVVEALAGTGKTSTILHALPTLMQRSALLCAFNKGIAIELQARVPVIPKTHGVHVKTFHALGLRILQSKYPKLRVDKNAGDDLIKSEVGFRVRAAAVKLMRVMKETSVLLEAGAHEDLLVLGYQHDLFEKLSGSSIGQAVNLATIGYKRSQDFATRETIDFSDMVWGAVISGIKPPSRYQAIFVDEFQDINAPQLALISSLIAPGGRLIAIGDPRQQIYQFRGSLGPEAWRMAKHDFRAKVLPLTTCFRCSEAVVTLAQQIVPEIKTAPDPMPGSVTHISLGSLPSMLNIQRGTGEHFHTFVLSRNNAALLDCALRLWRERVRFHLNAGKDMLDPLFHVIDQHLLMPVTIDAFKEAVDRWRHQEIARAERVRPPSDVEHQITSTYIDRVIEQSTMLLAAVCYVPAQAIGSGKICAAIKTLLTEILIPNQSGVLLSTVHKVKGLEAERVFLLKQTFAAHSGRYDEDHDGVVSDEELNIEYVAITRAKEHVIWVDLADKATEDVYPAKLDGVSLPDLHSLRDELERETMRYDKTDPTKAGELLKRMIDVENAIARKSGAY